MVTYTLSNTIARKRERFITLSFIKRGLFSIADIKHFDLSARYSTAFKNIYILRR